MKVLVTGAAGWSGAAVVARLLEAGHTVTAHDLPTAFAADEQRPASERFAVAAAPPSDGAQCSRVSGDLLNAADVAAAVCPQRARIARSIL